MPQTPQSVRVKSKGSCGCTLNHMVLCPLTHLRVHAAVGERLHPPLQP